MFPLLKSEELSFALMFSAVRKVLFQETSPEIHPIYFFLPGLHQLLHPHPPILCVCHQQKGSKRKLLCLNALDHLKYLLTLLQPCVCLIWGSLASEFCRLMTHKVLYASATGCIASTILLIAFAISSAPALFLRLLFAIACARHIFSC